MASVGDESRSTSSISEKQSPTPTVRHGLRANLSHLRTSLRSSTISFLLWTSRTVNALPVAASNSDNSTEIVGISSFVFDTDQWSRAPEGSIDGLGAIAKCRPQYIELLNKSSEFDKMASAAAALVMALLPSLLAFGPLKTANMRNLMQLDMTTGLLTAAFTLGLPVQELVTLGKEKVVAVRDLLREGEGNPDKVVGLYGYHEGEEDEERLHHTERIATIQSMFHDGDDGTGQRSVSLDQGPALRTNLREDSHAYKKHTLRTLHSEVLYGSDCCSVRGRPRRMTVQLITFVITVVQIVLGFVAAYFAPQIDKLYFIWDCPNATEGYTTFAWWFGFSIVTAAALKWIFESPIVQPDEVLHLSKAPPRAKPIACETLSATNGAFPGLLYLPRTSWAANFCKRMTKNVSTTALEGSDKSKGRKLRKARTRSYTLLLLSLLKERFTSCHPLVVILRPSPELLRPRHPMVILLIGYVQLAWISIISVIFGTTAGGSFFPTLAFVTAFVSTVAASRTLSVGLCTWLEQSLGLTVIEYDTKEEQRAILRILYSMPGVLVESQTGLYKYVDGYRIVSERSHALVHSGHTTHMHRRKASRAAAAGLYDPLGRQVPILTLGKVTPSDHHHHHHAHHPHHLRHHDHQRESSGSGAVETVGLLAGPDRPESSHGKPSEQPTVSSSSGATQSKPEPTMQPHVPLPRSQCDFPTQSTKTIGGTKTRIVSFLLCFTLSLILGMCIGSVLGFFWNLAVQSGDTHEERIKEEREKRTDKLYSMLVGAVSGFCGSVLSFKKLVQEVCVLEGYDAGPRTQRGGHVEASG